MDATQALYQKQARYTTTGKAFLIFVIVMMLMGAGAPKSVQALGETPAQIFFLSMPEDQVRTAFGVIDVSGGNFSNSMISITSIAVTVNGTVIYYDQWEDGYEASITSPVQSSTLIFGDGNTGNGNACTYAATLCSGDVLTAGAVLALRNNVPSNPRGTSVTFDAKDKLATTQVAAVTRAMWDSGVGTVLAGAIQVYDTNGYGTDFRLPVGENISASAMFDYAGLYIMAANDGTTVSIDSDGNGTNDYTTTLNAGGAYLLNGAAAGVTLNSNAHITSTLPIQVNLITGDINSQQKYENRWFNIPPLNLLGTSYVTPVSSMSNSNSNVFLYNPGGSSITVYAQTSSGTTNFSVAAGATYRYVMPTGSGARFYTNSGATFIAIGTNDSPDVSDNGSSAGSSWDWGYTLVAEEQLAPSLAVGWAPGSNALPPISDGSPVWVSAAAATTIYVDYDGNPATGPNVDVNGNHYDTSQAVTALQAVRFYDPDNDQTGMRVYTVDGTMLTATWGEDTSVAEPGNPYLDMGYVIFPLPQMAVTKDGVLDVTYTTPTDKANAGDRITYTLKVTNKGNRTLHNVTLVDAKLGTLTCTPTQPATLAMNQTLTCTGVYTVTQADIDAGVVYNTATGDSNETPPINVQGEVKIPKLVVTKTANPTAVPETGGSVTFTYRVKNDNATGSGVDLTIKSLTDSVFGTLAGDSDCQVNTVLAPQAYCEFTITRTVAGDYESGTAHVNKFTAVAQPTSGQNVAASSEARVEFTNVTPAIDVVKSVSVDGGATWDDANAAPGPYGGSGTNPRFRFVVTNTGPVTLSNLSLTDTSITTFYQSNLSTPCTIPASLAPGASFTCYGSLAWTEGQHTNTATATGRMTDGAGNAETATDTDSANYFGARPALTLLKTASPGTYAAVGQTISYSYVVKNTGNVPADGPVTVTDDKTTVTCPAGGLAPGAEMTCNASYTITQTDLDNGSVKNTATAHANGVNSNTDDETVTATQTRSLSLTKSADPATYEAVGQIIHYTFVIKNTGNVTLNGPFSVADNKANDEVCVQPADGKLSPAEEMTCTASYTITQADLDASSVTNTATATNGTVTSNQASATVNATALPALSLVKSASPVTYSHVGDVIHYSYAVKNIGNVAVFAPYTLTDDKAADESCPQTPSPLPVGATITCTASYTVTQADLDAGSVTNTASATATFGGNPVNSNQAQATANADKNPALTIDKTAAEANYDAVGDVIHYSYVVTNAGNVTLHDAITVSDNKAPVTCPALPPGGLTPGASITCTANYTIQQSDLDAGSLANVASATSGSITSPTDTVTLPADQKPALALVKSASPETYTQAGQTISYSYALKNTGNVTLSGPFTVSDNKATVSCPAVDSLAAGDTLICSASHVVTQAEVDSGSITNVARGHAVFDGKAVDSNQDSKTVTAEQSPELTLVKSASPTTYDHVGQVISYSYLLTNSGNVTLSGLFTVTDDKATDETCPATASLAPGGSITCHASYAISQADLDSGHVTNVASGHAAFNAVAVNSNPDTKTVDAIQIGGLGLSKSAAPGTYDHVGATITYTYTVKNTGNITLAGPFTVNDDKVGPVSCPAGSLAPNATVTCTATYPIKQSDLDAGSLTNTATATDGHLTSNEANATVSAVQKPALAINKTALTPVYTYAGEVILYNYVVTNTGNVTLHDAVVVSDDKALDETCPALPPEGLAPGASITCEASYIILQSDVDAGLLTNVASATSGTVASPTDSVTVPANQMPTLTLKKSANPLQYTTVGQVITYDYLLTNEGNVTLSAPFAVSDDKATVTCPAEVTNLAPWDMLNCTASYTITQTDLDTGNVINLATATAMFGPDTITSNQDVAEVTGLQDPVLTLVKTASTPTYDHDGQVIHYTYVLTNDGNVTLNGPFEIADDLTADQTCPDTPTLAPGASITCTSSYTINQADLDVGSVTNTAYGKASFLKLTILAGPETVTINAVPLPGLSLVKSATPTTYDHVGQAIAYSYVLKNTGNVTLYGITVEDDKVTVSCPDTPYELAPGATITCTASYSITQTDLDSGSVTNLATGFAQTLGGTPVTSNDSTTTVNAAQKPALTIDKTAQEATYASAGTVIHYSYKVTNSGNVTLHSAIVVSDNKTTATCPALPAGGLAPGGSVTCTASYTIKQSDLDAGSLTNVASAASGTVVSPTDTVTVPAIQNPHLNLSKTGVPHFSNPVKVGDTISYTLTAINDGNVTLANVTIVDPRLGVLSCNPGQPAILVPGDSLSCTGSYILTQADINAGKVENTATADSDRTEPVSAGLTVPVPQSPALSLVKSGALDMTVVAPSNRVDAGDRINYTLTAKNEGNVTLTHVTITDAKLGALTCVPAQPATLVPGDSLVCTGSYTLTQADINAGKVENTATADSDQTEPKTGSEQVPVVQSPHVKLTKTADPKVYDAAGQIIGYTMVATNDGNVTLTNVSISDSNAESLTCTPAQPAALQPGEKLTCTGNYTIKQADVDLGKVENTATVSGQPPSGPAVSDVANEMVTAEQKPALSIVKTATPGTYDAVGDVISYSYLVTNSGNLTLYNISVADDKATVTCPPTSAGLPPAATITCTASYTITQTDLDAGSVTNTATAQSGSTQSQPDSETVTAEQKPGLSIVKTASPTTYSKVGDVIHYSYVVTNTGNVTLHSLSVADDKATTTCPALPPAGIPPQGKVECTASYTIKQSDLDAGSVTNTATAQSGDTRSQPDSETVTAVQSPALSIVKTATPATYDAVGDVISYSYLVTNTGNVTLHTISVADDKATTTCPALPAGGLEPGASITCTASYSITQTDLDAGSVTNTATAQSGSTQSQPDSETVTAEQKPGLSIVKTATPATYDAVGDVISYSYLVTNTGNVTLHTISVTDDKATTTCPALPVGGLEPGASITCTASYSITQTDLDGGLVTNTAYAQSGNTKSPSDSETVTAIQSPAIALTKEANPKTYDQAGDVITYTIVATNTGNVTLHGVVVTDPKLGSLTCVPPVSVLAPGASISCTGSYTITLADLNAGSFSNTANVKGTGPGGQPVEASASDKVTAVQAPHLSLTKTALEPNYSSVGQILHYTITATNDGNVTLTAVSISDPSLGALTCTPAQPATLNPGQSLTCTGTHTVTQTDLDAGSYKNSATATGTPPSGEPITPPPAEVTVPAAQNPHISLAKAATPGTYDATGQVINYTLTAINDGNVTLHDVSISDPKLGTLTCTPEQPATLAPSEILTCTGTHAITQTDLDSGSYTNTASVSGKGPQDQPVSASADVTVTGTQKPHLSLTKTADPATYSKVGDVITYTLTATNDGNVTLTGVSISDSLVTGLTCTPAQPATLAPTEKLTCTGNYAVTQADLDAGAVSNTANAAGKNPKGGDVNAQPASATVTATQNPHISLVKTADPKVYDHVGQTIQYTIVATNDGNVTLHSVSITDVGLGALDCTPAQPATLAPTEKLTCTGSHTITQTDLDNGSYRNNASVSGTGPKGQKVDDSKTETVTAEPKPAISLTKTASPMSYSKAGDIIHYTYVVKNTGNVTLPGPFSISDDVLGTVACPAGALAPGATRTCTASHTVQQSEVDAGSIKNTAKASTTYNQQPVDSNEASVTVTASQTPALSLDKQAATANYAQVGDEIHYTYILMNTGNVTLSGPFAVSDDHATVTCPAADSLAPGASITCTATYIATQSDLDAGSVTNTATASGSFQGQPVTSGQDSATVPAVQSPALALTKSADPVKYDHTGQVISYTYVVKNTGNVTLHDPITVSDNKATVTCPALPAEGLVPGASITCTASYTITQADLNTGAVTNTATASTTFGNKTVTSNQATATVTADQKPAIDLTKEADLTTYSAVGDKITYTLTATNTGNVTLTNVKITDTLVDTTLTCTPAQGTSGVTLVPGATLVCKGTHTVTQADLNAGKVDNTGSATGKFGSTTVTDEASVSIPATQNPHLKLTKSGVLDKTVVKPTTQADVGDRINYTLVATNDGNITLTGVTITDAKIGALTCTPAQPATLAPGASMTCTGSYTLTQADIDAGKVDNTGVADSDKTEPVQTPNEVLIPQAPHISLTKTANPTTYTTAGQAISYTLVATNDGNVTLTGVTITDTTAGTLTCTPAQPATLAPGAKLTCTGTYLINQADLDGGKVTNTASVTGKPPSGENVSATATVTITAVKQPALSIDKTAKETTYAAVGDVLHYEYLVKNTGNVTLYGITVVDDKATVSCPDTSAGLAPGATITCTASYTITQADLDAGKVKNTAYAKSGSTQSLSDSVCVTATQNPHISLTKTADRTSYKAVGEVINYTITAVNDGNVTLTAVSIADAKLGTLTCTPAQPATLAPGAKLTCTGKHTVTQADIDAGSYSNTASVSGKGPQGQTVSAEDTETVNAELKPHMILTKTGTLDLTIIVPTDRADPLDKINYTLVVTNDGNTTLTNVTITDAKIGTLTCTPAQPATLAPGAKMTCTGRYKLTQEDIDAGKVDNTGVADSDQTAPVETPAEVKIVQVPILKLTKTANPTTYSAVGQVITYTITAYNDGNVTLHDVTITDPFLGTLTCTPEQPAIKHPRNELICTGTHVVTQADLDAGKITNTATASGTSPLGVVVTDTASATVTGSQQPGLSIDKTAKETTYAAVGDVLHYEYLVKNTGNIALPNVIVVDDKVTVSCPDTSAGLAPGATITCTTSYTITQADLDAGKVKNTAYAKSGSTQSPSDSVCVTATQNPHISLTKTADPASYKAVGEVINYTITAVNDGNVTLTAVSITDAKLGTLTCTPAQPATLAPGAKLTCTGKHTVTQADIDAGSYSNTASVSGKGPQGQAVKADATATVTGQAKPHLSLTKSGTLNMAMIAPNDRADVNDKINYTLVATNDGNTTLTNVTITDVKIGALTCTPAQPATLAPGAKLTCTGLYKLTQADIDAGKVLNTGIADSDQTDAVQAPAEVIIPQVPHLSLTKTADPTTYDTVGQVITYTITATNDGNVTLTDVSITDPFLGTLTCTPAQPVTKLPGQQLVCKGTHVVTQADLDAGKITNTATATGTPPIGDKLTATASVTVTASQKSSLSLDKTAVETSYAAVGEVLHYNYLVTNTGNTTLYNIIVVDDKVTVTCPDTPAGLPQNGSITCTASYTITQADLDAGKVKNTAYAKSGSVQSPSDSVCVNAVQNKSLSLTKTADPTTYETAGTVIHYTYVLTNTGNVTLSKPYAVADDKASDETCPADPAVLLPGESVTCTATYTITQADVDAGLVTNTAKATAKFNGAVVTSNTATATVTAVQQQGIQIEKKPRAQQVKVGGKIYWTIVVTNTGNVKLHNIVVTDPAVSACNKNFGTLTLNPGQSKSYTCYTTLPAKYKVALPHETPYDFINTAFVKALTPDNREVTDSAEAMVDILPAVDVQKIVISKSSVPYSGGEVSYAVKVYNLSAEPVMLTSLVDDKFGDLLDGQDVDCHDAAGQPYALPIILDSKYDAGSVFTCYFEKVITGQPGSSHINTVTAQITDNEGNKATDKASAKVCFFWYGLTPGYWKQTKHFVNWPEGYLPTDTVRSRFAVPDSLLSKGILDLNGDGKEDTLLNALGYKGGSTLKGKAQILLRAATAALLNEAKFGDMYPTYGSVQELTDAVNQVLETQDGTAYTNLAKELDRLNNGTEPKP